MSLSMRRMAVAVVAAGIAGLLPALWIRLLTRRLVHRDPDDVGRHAVAVVLGAGVLPDGTPSRMLVQRVRAGCDLLERGQVSQLLLSGDGQGSRGHDEVSVMRDVALFLGAPAESLHRGA